MDKQQIIDLWRSVGWNDLKSYLDHLNSAEDRHTFDELHPDKINSKLFWETAGEYFGTDPICNHSNNPDQVLNTEQANLQNWRIPQYLGMHGQAEMLCAILNKTFGKINIAEIGCGFDAIHNLYFEIENTYWPNTSYTGFDVTRRSDTDVEVEGEDGTFSDEQVEKYTEKFNLFYSSNTFQHLSPKKVEKYLRQVYTMLPYGGYFNLMYAIGVDKTYHYGQVVDIITVPNLINLIKTIGYNIVGSANMEMDNSITPFSYVLKK
jgi:hypothetical protein